MTATTLLPLLLLLLLMNTFGSVSLFDRPFEPKRASFDPLRMREWHPESRGESRDESREANAQNQPYQNASQNQTRNHANQPAPFTIGDDAATSMALLSLEDDSPLAPTLAYYHQLAPHPVPATLAGLVTIKHLTTPQLRHCLQWYFNKPLPCINDMFPWLHGLHADNYAQRQFFTSQALVPTPVDKPSHVRFLMCIQTDDDNRADPFTTNFLTQNNFHFYHKPLLQALATLVVKNTVKLRDVLRQVDVSRVEVRALVTETLDAVFPDADVLQVAEVFVQDCLRVRFLPQFLNLDPDRGVLLRNFHIQVAKVATCLDFVVYGSADAASVARVLWLAQQHERFCHPDTPTQYLVFVHQGPFDDEALSWRNDYIVKEKVETTRMLAATCTDRHVWVGNYWDYHLMKQERALLDRLAPKGWPHMYCDPENLIVNHRLGTDVLDALPVPKANWRLLVHCHAEAKFPLLTTLGRLIHAFLMLRLEDDHPTVLDFPPSGAVGMGDCKRDTLEAVLNTCKLVYAYLLLTLAAADVVLTLIFCSDGYTELLLLVLCYLMYALDLSVGDAMLKLHCEYGRPFYIFPSDVGILQKLERLLRRYSPVVRAVDWLVLEQVSPAEINDILLGPAAVATSLSTSVSNSGALGLVLPQLPTKARYQLGYIALELDDEPEPEPPAKWWVADVDGLLPLRILPYMYLGSLKHANCPELLTRLGITKIISVGERLDWVPATSRCELVDGGDVEMISVDGPCLVDTIMKVNNLRDDGIDALSHSLPQILGFLHRVYEESGGEAKVLVHCRVGVSRLATVAIAEVMKRLNITIPEAYLYVRVRRLNIIIQPNLRFMYELFKWEEQEKLQGQAVGTNLREVDWFIMCREIMKLNLPYLS